jgi:hypothetical protein
MTASVALTSSYSQQGAPCAARYSLPDDTHVGLPFMSAHMIGVLKKRDQVDGGASAHKRWLAPRRALLVRRSWVASRRTAALSVKAPGSGVISASVAVV